MVQRAWKQARERHPFKSKRFVQLIRKSRAIVRPSQKPWFIEDVKCNQTPFQMNRFFLFQRGSSRVRLFIVIAMLWQSKFVKANELMSFRFHFLNSALKKMSSWNIVVFYRSNEWGSLSKNAPRNSPITSLFMLMLLLIALEGPKQHCWQPYL